MILLGNMYQLDRVEVGESVITCALTLEASHAIFAGHFPATPVVPGVCMMQVIKEIFEEVTGKKTRLTTADSLKFLRVINPLVDPALTCTIGYRLTGLNSFIITAELAAVGLVCFKMTAFLREIDAKI